MRSRLWWALGILSLIAGIIVWWWVGRTQNVPIERIPPNQPGMTLEGTSLVGLDKGKKAWEVKAGRIWRSKDGLITVFEEIEDGTVYNQEELVHFRAPLARLDQVHQIMTVQGGIQGKLKDGSFSTATVRIDLLRKEMTSDGKVRFRYEDMSVTADGLRADLEKEIVYLIGNVHLQDGEQSLNGKEISYDLNEKTYELIGETEVEMEL